MRVLVTGGAGYIGSHMVACLLREGHHVAVVDALLSGRREAVPTTVPFLQANIAETDRVAAFLDQEGIEAILHFASRIQVGESVTNPRLYYQDNLGASIALAEAALRVGIQKFIFSSSAAVYGIPDACPIPETHPTRPINPYGHSKLAIEEMLASYDSAYGLRSVSLRYFNAAGALRGSGLGECHEPETHLIPLVLDVALGKRPKARVFGVDYPTADGSCVRDYIHVVDLVEAHLAALDYLGRGGKSAALNLGTGQGHSVKEVIRTCEEVTKRTIPAEIAPRREGDPPMLVASPDRARQVLGWNAKRSSLKDIVEDAWAWQAR